MKILLINHYAGTPELGMEYRPYYLAREWVRMGHQVLVLAASHSHVRSRQPQAGGQTLDGIAYCWYETPAYAGNGFGRLRNIWAFCRHVAKDADILARDFAPDVVIASSTYPMDVWVARKVARLAQAKLVYEVHDLWPLSPIELSGMSPWHPFALLCQKAENDAYRDADRVVSMLPKVQQHMAAHGLDLSKLHIVPNGITLDEWDESQAPGLRSDIAAHIATQRAAGKLVVGYAGSHGLPNALDVLLDAAKLLQAQDSAGQPPLHIVMVGGGHEKARLAARVREEGIAQVAMFDAIPKAQIPALLAAFDIAYIGWQRTPIYRFGIAPNKLMDYMMARRPVLHSVEAGNDPVAEAGAGLTVPPEDAQAVAQGLRQLAALSPQERAAMGERGRAFVLAHHTYPVLARRFIEAVS
ncbi:MAG: glycosyltransferase family 4 protein [Roseateles asaccharophilus]|uniref:Glycosyltransferase involved in cell wall biosynthesis n=1 Tax=Roseateles asaccharophilus TaxID=582607 RepID=A0A4R6MZC9_9BURK|nr:glycosyltransferase family 4 protein [Roseateles asaccharophilus]MDN3545740.1 glycosyltransferase family 4 protein [Roseateles asaccharophilus]TDP07608.1 glycosyltransferase involved in cell wall biosynthesis [Roseateles asaccharophilus]